jgi:hypothetical protein
MTTQPPVLDAHTKAMNEWFEKSFTNCMRPHLEQIDCFADEVGVMTGQTARMLLELMTIVKHMSISDDYSRGSIDVLIRSFKAQRGIEHTERMAVEFIDERTERTTERTSKRSVKQRSLSDIVSSVDVVDNEV